MTPEQIEKERVAFESYIMAAYTDPKTGVLKRDWKLKRDGEGYFWRNPSTAWKAWLARAEQPAWVSVKEMGPEDGEWVLVCIDYEDGNETDIALYDEGGYVFIHPPCQMIDGVTHWQPLPPPPKGD